MGEGRYFCGNGFYRFAGGQLELEEEVYVRLPEGGSYWSGMSGVQRGIPTFWAGHPDGDGVLCGPLPDPSFGWGNNYFFGWLQDDPGYNSGSAPSLTNPQYEFPTMNSPIAGTSFVSGPEALVQFPNGDVFYRTKDNFTTKTRYGRVVNNAWEDLIDLSTPPPEEDTGLTFWIVRGVAPVPAILGGGYIVGAMPFFNFYDDETSWPMCMSPTGSNNHNTFPRTGTDYVPHLAGMCGQLSEPRLFVFTDQWATAARSVLGPDILMYYDANGQYVETLNDWSMHATEGRGLMTTEDGYLFVRVYRWGTYSSYAGHHGEYLALDGDRDKNAPLIAVYKMRQFGPGIYGEAALDYQGCVNMGGISRFEMGVPGSQALSDNRVTAYQYEWNAPMRLWSPPYSPILYPGSSGGITPLQPGAPQSRGGVRGVGSPQR